MKSVLITGAGSGLGRGTAIGLARAGHRVFATTQLWAQATDLRREVERLGLSDKLVVDKPFIFALRDRVTGLVLVSGYVGAIQPEATR